MKKIFLATFLFALVLISSVEARAASVSTLLLSPGYEDTKSDAVGGFAGYGLNASLDSLTKAVFTFSLNEGAFTGGIISAGVGSTYLGSLISPTPTQTPAVASLTDLYISLAWSDSLKSGTATIINYAQKAVALSLSLFGGVAGSSVFTAHVEASAVPLPAALPLFGLGLASLVGYASRRKGSKAE